MIVFRKSGAFCEVNFREEEVQGIFTVTFWMYTDAIQHNKHLLQKFVYIATIVLPLYLLTKYTLKLTVHVSFNCSISKMCTICNYKFDLSIKCHLNQR